MTGAMGLGLGVASLSMARSEQGISSKQFTTLKCESNEVHTHDTRKITLALPEGTNWNETGAIANVQVRTPAAGGDDKPVTRSYNPLDADQQGSLTLLVKRYGQDAKMGSALHGLAPGDEVLVKGPNTQWKFEQGKVQQYAMIAGGTGLTPLLQAATYVLQHDDKAQVRVICFNKTPEDILLALELQVLARRHPGRLAVQHVVEKGAGFATKDTPLIRNGKVTKKLLKELLPSPYGEGVLVMVCGRGDMTGAIAGPKAKDYSQGPLGGLLLSLGFTVTQVRKV